MTGSVVAHVALVDAGVVLAVLVGMRAWRRFGARVCVALLAVAAFAAEGAAMLAHVRPGPFATIGGILVLSLLAIELSSVSRALGSRARLSGGRRH